MTKYGSPSLKSRETFEENLELKELNGDEDGMASHIWAKAESKKSGKVTQNKAGFRVLVTQVGDGAYPPFLISSHDVSITFEGFFSVATPRG